MGREYTKILDVEGNNISNIERIEGVVSIPENVFQLYKTGYVFLGIINIIICFIMLMKNRKENRIKLLLIISIAITIVGYSFSEFISFALKPFGDSNNLENIYAFIIKIINYIIQTIIFIVLIINITKHKKKEGNKLCQE